MKHRRTVVLGVGPPCPKCSRPMERCQHGPEWQPKPMQPYYFSYWDRCKPCGHVQHYEAAKVHLDVREPEGTLL